MGRWVSGQQEKLLLGALWAQSRGWHGAEFVVAGAQW